MNICLLLKPLLFLSLITIINSDICLYQDDGAGLLNTYHEIYISGGCYPCHIQCKTCNSLQDLTCSLGNCQDYYFYDSSLSICKRCSPWCKKCTGYLQSQCQICIDGYYFDQTYNKCKQCPYQSKQCSGMIIYSCFEKYYFDSQSFICRKCSSNCINCLSSILCTICQDRYFLTSNNSCIICSVSHCKQCLNNTACYECMDGFQIDGSQLCALSNCLFENCLNCPQNQSLCTKCQQNYFLYDSKCYFGSSILCKSGKNGSSYGKCFSCIDQYAFSTIDNPSYCLLSQSSDANIKYQFLSYGQFFLCISPQFLTSTSSKQIKITLTVEALFQIDLVIRLISQISEQQIQIILSDSKNLGSYSQLNNSQRITDSFYCKQKNTAKTIQYGLVHKIKESYYINSLSSQIIILIRDSDLNQSRQIFMSELLIIKHTCAIPNCRTCFSTNLCSFCSEGFFLEEYQCKILCSQGYYADSSSKKCVYKCQMNYFINLQTSSCQKCPHQCKMCQNSTFCYACIDDCFLYQNKCLNICLNNTTYQDTNLNECSKCKSPCKTCTIDGENCVSCLQGYLLNNKCLSQCPLHYFQDFYQNSPICSVCSSQCTNCQVNANFCTACANNLTLSKGECLSECPSKYLKQLNQLSSQNDFICKACDSTCIECEAQPQNCTSCVDGYFLGIFESYLIQISTRVYNRQIQNLFNILHKVKENYNDSNYAGTCITKCPSSYYYQNQNTKICQKCTQNCIKCMNYLNCQFCTNGTYLSEGICVNVCPSPGYFMEKATNTCKKCRIPCSECVTDNIGNKCLKCTIGYYSLNVQNSSFNSTNTINVTSSIVQCLLRCPLGYYKTNSNQPQCALCPLECSSCEQNNKCLSCKENFILSDKYVCSLSQICSDGYFLNKVTLMCQKCLPACKTCINFDYFCTECSSQVYLQKQNGICSTECQQGYFQETNYLSVNNNSNVLNINQTNINSIVFLSCEKCHENCSICLSAKMCTKCNKLNYLFEGYCIWDCPLMYFKTISSEGRFCASCSQKCLNCSQKNKCFQCSSDTVLLENQCYSQCFDGYYLQNSLNLKNQTVYNCWECKPQCQLCANQTSCTSCYPGYFSYFNKINNFTECRQKCDQGQWPNKLSRVCENCDYPCKTCFNRIVCLSCKSNLSLINQNCVQNCPQSFYLSQFNNANDLTCFPCSKVCQICSSDFKCISCKLGYFLDQNLENCVLNCPSKYFQNFITRKCQDCQKPCLKCSNKKDECQSCLQGFYFSNNVCLPICPLGTYLQQNICKNCSANCKVCQELSICVLCKQGLFQHKISEIQNICLSVCPQNFYQDFSRKSCQRCNQKCLTCKSDQHTCTSCQLDYFLLRNTCVYQCPQFYSSSINQNKCKQCGQWCQVCLDYETCFKCTSGYLYQGKCLNECPLAQFQDKQNLTCMNCMEGCENCLNQFLCEQCSLVKGFVLYSNKCIKLPCPQGLQMFEQENICLDRCPQLVDKSENKCYSQKCPLNKILSSHFQQCTQSCLRDQFLYLEPSLNQVICKSTQILLNANIQLQKLPQFKLTLMSSNQELIVVLFFSFNALEQIGSQQIQQKLLIKVQSLSSYQNQMDIQAVTSQLQHRLLQKNFNSSQPSIQANSCNIMKNAAFFSLRLKDLNNIQNSEVLKQFQIPIKITLQIKNPSQDFLITEKYLKIPLQNYKQSIFYTYLNYQQNQNPKSGTKIVVWILISVSLIIMVALIFLNKKLNKLYLFASIIQLYQTFFFSCFIFQHFPILLETFFYEFRFIAGNLFMSEVIRNQSSQTEEIMESPWQFYQYSTDVNSIKNLADVLLILTILVFMLISSKILTYFQNPFQQLAKKIMQMKLKILQTYFWLFIHFIGIYALINIFYGSSQQKFFSHLQKSIGYKILNYFFSILFFLCPIYFFYLQYKNKNSFDKGLDKQKRKLGVSIPLYRFLRKLLFVFFLSFYYRNPVYAICIHLMSTSIIFILIFWYEPYLNKIRQTLSVIEEGSLFVLFAQLLIFILNPDFYKWICPLFLIHAILQILLLLVYPLYCLYFLLRYNQDTEQNISIQKMTEISQNWFKDYHKQKDSEINNDSKSDKFNSVSTKLDLLKKIRNKQVSFIDNQEKSANQADQSDQGQIAKKQSMNNVIRLAKKDTKKIKQFKNYAFNSSNESENSECQQTSVKKI